MLIDLATYPATFIASICPHSLVVRTIKPLGNQLNAKLKRPYSTRSEKGTAEELEPSAVSRNGAYELTETFVPLEPSFHQQIEKLDNPWKVSSWPAVPGKAERMPWSVAVLVRQQPGGVYQVVLGDVAKDSPLASVLFRIDTIRPLHADRLPLTETRKKGLGNAYDRILDE